MGAMVSQIRRMIHQIASLAPRIKGASARDLARIIEPRMRSFPDGHEEIIVGLYRLLPAGRLCRGGAQMPARWSLRRRFLGCRCGSACRATSVGSTTPSRVRFIRPPSGLFYMHQNATRTCTGKRKALHLSGAWSTCGSG